MFTSSHEVEYKKNNDTAKYSVGSICKVQTYYKETWCVIVDSGPAFITVQALGEDHLIDSYGDAFSLKVVLKEQILYVLPKTSMESILSMLNSGSL